MWCNQSESCLSRADWAAFIAPSPSGLYRTSTFVNVGSNASMCAPNSEPYSKSKSFWPDFSAGIASTMPACFASLAT